MTNPAAERYSRQVLLKEWGEAGQRALSEAHFVVIGAGGIGSPALLALAEAGAGRITVIDSDTVDETNLPRQILHIPARIGMNKAESAKRMLSDITPDVPVTAVAERADDALLARLLDEKSILLDCSDNFKTRHTANRAAHAARRPLVTACAVRFSFQIAVFDFSRHLSPCYQCTFPEDEEKDVKAAQTGVSGPVTAIAGMFAAQEAIKLVLGVKGLDGKLLIGDTLTMKFDVIGLSADPACSVCAK